MSCRSRSPAHPGAVLSDVFEGLGLTNAEIARRLGISRQHLLNILAERKPVSANIAVRFGRLLGQNGGIWLLHAGGLRPVARRTLSGPGSRCHVELKLR